MFKNLKSVIYPTKDLQRDKKFWEEVTGIKPYFEEAYYVGFNINGCELGLDPNSSIDQPVAYWNVEDARQAAATLIEKGSVVNTELSDVGGGMMMGTFKDPTGNIFGIIDHQSK